MLMGTTKDPPTLANHLSWMTLNIKITAELSCFQTSPRLLVDKMRRHTRGLDVEACLRSALTPTQGMEPTVEQQMAQGFLPRVFKCSTN